MHQPTSRNGLAAVACAMCAWTGAAAGAEPAAPAGCTAPEYRRLDFKLGEFDVTGIGGARAGASKVDAVLGGCLLVEYWQGAISGSGRAHMFYDKRKDRWELLYISDEGDVMRFAGAFLGESLVLTGENSMASFEGLHRMTFSPRPDGGSLQLWELSVDGGKTWKTIHEGTYVRRDRAVPR